MIKVSLSEAAEAVSGQLVGGDAEISSISIDSRSVEPGCLFFAIMGENFDGHSFVKSAFAGGAVAAVVSRVPEDIGTPYILVDDTRAALMSLAAHYRRKFDIPVVGLTGSVGKTTTKDMIAAVLSQKYSTLATVGNLNNEIGLPQMCFMLDGATQAAVLEMGMSGFGEISRLSRCAAPTVGLITNIGVSHIEMLGSREGILKAKLEIADGLAEGAPLLLNGDNDLLRTVDANAAGGHPVKFYGIENDQSVCRAIHINEKEDTIEFDILYQDEKYAAVLPVVGRHNIYNALAAFLCGMELEVTPEQAVCGLREYTPDKRRQNITHTAGITIIEDCYNASPDSIAASVAVLRDIHAQGRRIAVLGDMLELGDHARAAHHSCGELLRDAGIDMLFAYGRNAMYYIEGAGEAVASRLYDDKASLTADLLLELEPGDAVLFKASRGMKLEDCISGLYDGLNIK